MEKLISEFKKGYFYKFTDGRSFYVDDICACDRCEERGLLEPKVYWLNYLESPKNEDAFPDYICGRNDELIKSIEKETADKTELWIKQSLQESYTEKREELEKNIRELKDEYKQCLDFYISK